MTKLNLGAVEAVKKDKKAGKLTLNKKNDSPKVCCDSESDYVERRYISIDEVENGYKVHTNGKTYVAADAKEVAAVVEELLNVE